MVMNFALKNVSVIEHFGTYQEQMMVKGKPLFLYEEIMLLALRDEQGTIATGFPEQVVAGAIMPAMISPTVHS